MKQNPKDAIFTEMGFPPEKGVLSSAVLYSLARTHSILLRELAPIYKRHGLTVASFNLLMLLSHGSNPEGFTQQAIGERLVVSASDMSGLIDRLERKGLVKRLPGKDRRSKLLRTTAKGNKVLEKVWPEHVAAVIRLTERLKEPEQKEIVRLLGKLRQG